MASIDLNEDSDGSTCPAAVGDEITLTLGETPTSGYRWAVETIDLALLEPASDEYEPPDAGQLGGKGTHRWTFRVVGPGTTALRLVLKRAWDSDSA